MRALNFAISKYGTGRALFTVLVLFMLVATAGTNITVAVSNNNSIFNSVNSQIDPVKITQDEITSRITTEYGERTAVNFNGDECEGFYISDAKDGARGSGVMRSQIHGRVQFTFNSVVNKRRGRVESGQINFDDGSTLSLGRGEE